LSCWNTSTYVDWFGLVDRDRWNIVTQIYTKNVALLRRTFPHRCDPKECRKLTYAFVIPVDKTHTISLCTLFWTAPSGLFELNSRAGVLIHESTHFLDIGPTSDLQYGEDDARTLAKKNPKKAIKNADNYEYFCESKPTC